MSLERCSILIRSLISLATAALICVFACPVFAGGKSVLHKGSFYVDGRKLSYFCTGTSTPSIILEAPSGISNEEAFSNVLAELSQRGRVCAYDRAYYGDSDALQPGTVQTVHDYAEELRQLLALEQVPSPHLLVGFSYGGFVVRYYAGHHPESIVGMVLIDSPHVRWLRTMKEELSDDDWGKVEDIMEWFIQNRGHDVWESQFLVEQAPPLRADLSIAVITRDQDHDHMRQSGISEAGFRVYNDTHFRLAPELMRLSERTISFTAEDTDHMIPDNDPKVVIEAVDQILSIVRAKSEVEEAQ